MRILVIEDNREMNELIRGLLAGDDYAVDACFSAEAGLRLLKGGEYDVIVLDIMLPGMSGMDFLREIRELPARPPVLVLSAKSGVEDKVSALDGGGDDYLTKPFAGAELLARIRTLLRRGPGSSQPNPIRIADLEIDTGRREARRGGQTLELTGKEYEILEFLAYNCGRVVNRVALYEHVWGETFDYFSMSNFLDVHIKNLRKKIDADYSPKLLRTRRGVGFILSDGGDEA